MIIALLLLPALIGLAWWISGDLHRRFPETDLLVFKRLIAVHYGLALVYYWYALNNPSDSIFYFVKVSTFYRGNTWFDFYGVSTTFVEFIAYPFVHYLQFSYEACMILFAWFGLIGFFFFYVLITERVKTSSVVWGIPVSTLILYLPNLHFWSSSFGKGSVVFLGFGMFFFALSRLDKRWPAAILGAVLIYHIRPHILFIVVIASVLGFVFSTKGLSASLRVAAILVSLAAFYFIREDVFAMVGIDEENLVTDSTTLSHRAQELSKATSGIDINNYNWPLKLFTFWFRPLFFDAPGALGLFVSVENVLYLVLFLNLLRPGFWSWFMRSDYLAKTAALTFFGVSFALSQLSGNLGIAIRQKSQVMILMLFVILKYLDEKRAQEYAPGVPRPVAESDAEDAAKNGGPSSVIDDRQEPVSRLNPNPSYRKYLDAAGS